MTKYYTQIKEPVTIRCGVRTYEFLKLYIIPERNVYDKAINKATIDAEPTYTLQVNFSDIAI